MKDTRKFSIPLYGKMVARTFKEVERLGIVKGGEYAGDEDRLANFRRNAEATGVTMEAVWRVYAGKHWDAISQFVSDVQAGKTRIRAESLEGRVDDMIVYLLLFKAMLVEREAGIAPKAPRAPRKPRAPKAPETPATPPEKAAAPAKAKRTTTRRKPVEPTVPVTPVDTAPVDPGAPDPASVPRRRRPPVQPADGGLI